MAAKYYIVRGSNKAGTILAFFFRDNNEGGKREKKEERNSSRLLVDRASFRYLKTVSTTGSAIDWQRDCPALRGESNDSNGLGTVP